MNIVSSMFEVISSAVTAFVSAFGNALTSVSTLLYTEADGFTLIGTLVLITVGVGLVYFAWRLVKGLIAKRRA